MFIYRWVRPRICRSRHRFVFSITSSPGETVIACLGKAVGKAVRGKMYEVLTQVLFPFQTSSRWRCGGRPDSQTVSGRQSTQIAAGHSHVTRSRRDAAGPLPSALLRSPPPAIPPVRSRPPSAPPLSRRPSRPEETDPTRPDPAPAAAARHTSVTCSNIQMSQCDPVSV